MKRNVNNILRFGARIKRAVTGASILLFVQAQTFAQSSTSLVPKGLEDFGDGLLEAFTGKFAQTILAVCFAGSCIAYAYNKDNEKMKSKVMAVMIACGLLVLSTAVLSKVWGAGGGSWALKS